MINNLNKSISILTFFGGLSLLPVLAFSQQEEPKRVSIVVTAKAIKPEKELVQIPADNFPKTIDRSNVTSYKRYIATQQKHNSSTPATATEKPARKTSSPTKPTIRLQKTSVANTVQHNATKKPTPQKVPEKNLAANSYQTEAETVGNNSKPSTQNIERIVAKSESIKSQSEASTNGGAKESSFSYIWIGSFLIIAGLVLGLLFGKPAFLISFVGVVFVVLGMMI